MIFKRFKNVESSRVLANELIAYKIAIELGLPIPNAGCAVVDGDTVIQNEAFTEDCGEHSDFLGMGFYSELQDKVSLVTSPMQLANVINCNEIPRIIMFDHLIYNADRNPGNMLVDMKKGDKMIHIIDHTHIFYLGPMWDMNQLKLRITDNDVLHNDIVEKNKMIYDILMEHYSLTTENLNLTCEDFVSKLSSDKFKEIVFSIPHEWNICDEDKDELCRYLTYRLKSLPLMAELLVKGGE